MVDTLWRLVRGASNEPRPAAAEIGRRYVDCSPTTSASPGSASCSSPCTTSTRRRDLVGAVLAAVGAQPLRGPPRPGWRRARPRSSTSRGRSATCWSDFLLGALRLPVATAPQPIAVSGRQLLARRARIACAIGRSWRCGSSTKLAAVGVEQVILVSPAAAAGRARTACAPSRPDLRARGSGEIVRSIETAALQDAWARGPAAVLRRLRHPARSQSDRPVRFRAASTTSVRPPAHRCRTDAAGLRRRVPAVHRAGGRGRRADRGD